MKKVGKYLQKANNELDLQAKDIRFVMKSDEGRYKKVTANLKNEYANEIKAMNVSLKSTLHTLNKELMVTQEKIQQLERQLERSDTV